MLTDALMAKAYAQQGLLTGKGFDHSKTDTRLVRRTRARRDHHAIRIERQGLLDGDCIVAVDLLLHAKLAEILDEIVSEGVEIIDD